MAPKDDALAIAVFTADTVEYILAQGGTGGWVVNPAKAGKCNYVVCCRKENWKTRNAGIPPRAAFLVGLISGLQKHPGSDNDRGQARFLIEISEYATLNKPGVWKEDARNPVAYVRLDDVGIDPRRLKFKRLASPTGSRKATAKTMTIAEAKKVLAASLGVRPEDVEITIRG